MDRIDSELCAFKAEMADFKKDTEEQFSSIRSEMSELNSKVSSIKTEISSIKAQMKKYNAINSREHQDMIDIMNSKFYDLENTVKTIENDLNTVFVSNKYEHDLFKKKLAINI